MSSRVHDGFSERFNQALEEAGISEHTQKELGRLFGVSAQAIRKWQYGEAMPSAERAPRVAKVLGVRRAWLLDNELPVRVLEGGVTETGRGYGADKAQGLSHEEHQLLSQFRLLDKPLQKEWVRLLKAFIAMR